jgi:Chloride channel protein EriC
MPALTERQMVAIGGGAGLAGGFNTPLLGVVFMLEELTAEYSIVTIWPALLVCVAAAEFSNLGGEPIFGLGLINVFAPEKEQLLLAIPIGIAAGLVGGFFNRGLVWTTARLALNGPAASPAHWTMPWCLTQFARPVELGYKHCGW